MTRRRSLPAWLGAILLGLSSWAIAGPAEMAHRAPGRHALEFDGESSFVWLRQPIPDGLAQGTVELWFRLHRPWEGGTPMTLIGDDAGRMNLALRENKLAFNKDIDGPSSELALRPARLGTGWHHAAGVWGKGGTKLFLDGKLVASRPEDERPYRRAKTPYDIVPIETRLGLASTWWGDRRYHRFDGQVAFARISEQRLYEGDYAPVIESPAESKSDVLRYDFAEGRGDSLRDSGGRGNDGSIAGCTWRELDSPPRLAKAGPTATETGAGSPVVIVPFGCHPEMMADPIDLQGFHLTAAWALNVLGGLPVATEARALALLPQSGFPHRARFDDRALAALFKAGAAAVAHGYIEPAGDKSPEDRSAPARLTLRVLRPDRPAWVRTIDLKTQSAAAYGEAQRAAARLLCEEVVPEGRRVDWAGLPDEGASDQVKGLWRRARARLLDQDTFALLRAASDAAESVQAEPRRAEGWRLLAQSYAWLAASPSRTYTSATLAPLARARAAHNVALLLDGDTPETALTGALIARFVPDYSGARSAALRLADGDRPWSPEQRAILALAAGEEGRLPAAVGDGGPFEPLVRGRIRLANAKRPLARESFEEAWRRNGLATAAPGLVAQAAGSTGVGTLRRIAAEAMGTGLAQAVRILAWHAPSADGDPAPTREMLRRVAEVIGRPAPDLGDVGADPGAIDRAALAALSIDGRAMSIDTEVSLPLLAILVDFERRASGAVPDPSGVNPPGRAPSPEPSMVLRLARVEAQSGFDILLRLLVQSLGVPDEAHQVLDRLVATCGYDTMTAHWATLFLTGEKTFKGKLPWPPALPLFDPAFDRGFAEVISLEPTYRADLYRDARRRFPSWDLPWSAERRPEAYDRDPYDEVALRLWIGQARGSERRPRLDQALASTPESVAARRVVAEVLLRDVSSRDEARGLKILEALVAEDPDAAAPYRTLAGYFLDVGQPDDAVEWYGRLAARPLESLEPTSALLRIAAIERDRHEPARALPVLEAAAQSFQGTALMRYAWALSESGQVDQAVELFEAARERYAPGPSILAWEAAALFKAGRRDRARSLLAGFVRGQPYGVSAVAAREYIEETGDHDPIPGLKDRLGAGRAGNLVLARASLELGRPGEAIGTARATKDLGQVSGADRPGDVALGRDLLARAIASRYARVRSGEHAGDPRGVLEGLARREGLANLAAMLQPMLGATSKEPNPGEAKEGKPGEKTATRKGRLADALEILATSGRPEDPGTQVARLLASVPRLDEALLDRLSPAETDRIGPDNALRLAARDFIRGDRMPEERRKDLATALVRLNPTGTWASQQAAIYALGHGPDSRPRFLDLVRDLKLPAPDEEAYRLAADSWADWHLLGPFPDDKLDGIRRPYLDESRPVDLGEVVRSGEKELRWRRPLEGISWGGVSLAAELGMTFEPSVAYAFREIDVPGGTTQHLVLTGPQSARVFLNGRELGLWAHSPEVSDRLELDLPLDAGVNRLLLKLRYPGGPGQSLWCRFPGSP